MYQPFTCGWFEGVRPLDLLTQEIAFARSSFKEVTSREVEGSKDSWGICMFFFVSLSSWLVVILKIVLKCAENDYCFSINHDLLGAVRYSQQLSTCLVLVFASLCHLYYCEVAHADHAVCMNGFLMIHNKGASIDFTIRHSGHTPYYVTL